MIKPPIEKVSTKKILVVEDDVDILETTTELLELKGYTVVAAKNGQIGLESAKNERPDLIISDVTMPKMNGFELLNALRANAKTAMIPFVFLTAKAQKGDKLLGASSGADRYLTKPFTMVDLLRNIKEILECVPQ